MNVEINCRTKAKTNDKINSQNCSNFIIISDLSIESALYRRISLAKYSDIAISENGNSAFVFVLLYRDTISLVDSIILNYDV